jgi:hypothetical protein
VHRAITSFFKWAVNRQLIQVSRSQIQRIYDRHDRLPEMRQALELYEKHLAVLIAAR